MDGFVHTEQEVTSDHRRNYSASCFILFLLLWCWSTFFLVQDCCCLVLAVIWFLPCLRLFPGLQTFLTSCCITWALMNLTSAPHVTHSWTGLTNLKNGRNSAGDLNSLHLSTSVSIFLSNCSLCVSSCLCLLPPPSSSVSLLLTPSSVVTHWAQTSPQDVNSVSLTALKRHPVEPEWNSSAVSVTSSQGSVFIRSTNVLRFCSWSLMKLINNSPGEVQVSCSCWGSGFESSLKLKVSHITEKDFNVEPCEDVTETSAVNVEKTSEDFQSLHWMSFQCCQRRWVDVLWCFFSAGQICDTRVNRDSVIRAESSLTCCWSPCRTGSANNRTLCERDRRTDRQTDRRVSVHPVWINFIVSVVNRNIWGAERPKGCVRVCVGVCVWVCV